MAQDQTRLRQESWYSQSTKAANLVLLRRHQEGDDDQILGLQSDEQMSSMRYQRKVIVE